MSKKRQPRKLSDKQIEYYRQLLIEKLQEILGDVGLMEESVFSSSGELSSMPVHLADIGTDSYEQEFNLGLMAGEKKLIAEIMQALQRINENTYGFCEGLGILIEANRLEAIPWTRYSLEYAKLLENGKTVDVKLRPIDIQRDNEEIEDEEDTDDQDEDLTPDNVEFDSQMLSLDELEDEDEDNEDEDDLNHRRNSA